ncbi:hypothetical protein LBMAG53_32030 [Planctomycetota bacterium]|nr:hypothetical protein LBMAG53_32030 [Planctomycetota bacterium]
MSDFDLPPLRQQFTVDLHDSIVLGGRTAGAAFQLSRVAHERWLHPTHFHRPDTGWRCLAVVLAGSGVFFAEGRHWKLGPGSVFTFAPGGYHAYRSLAGASLEIVICEFFGNEAEALQLQCLGRVRGVVTCASMVLVGEAARLLHATAHDGRAFSGDACAGLLRGLLYLIAGERDPSGQVIGRGEMLVERARGMIHRDWASLAGPAAVAAQCGTSHAHLCRLFRERLGTSPGAYLQQIRMRHAARSLIEHPESLATIAARLGFSDQFAFSKCFKRVMGMPPRLYQQRSLPGAAQAQPSPTGRP